MDLNLASEEALASVVGDKRASKIVKERSENGRFLDFESVGPRTPGISARTVEKLKAAGFVIETKEDPGSSGARGNARGAPAAAAAAADAAAAAATSSPAASPVTLLAAGLSKVDLGKTDLNQASEQAIAAVVGANKASKIVQERGKNGVFADLESVGPRTHGISLKTVEKLRAAGFVVGGNAATAKAPAAATSPGAPLKDLTKEFEQMDLGSSPVYAKAAPAQGVGAAATSGAVVTAAVVGSVDQTGWPHDRRIAVPAEFKGARLTELPQSVAPQDGGREKVAWGGQIFTQSEWRKTLLAWEKKYPKLKKHPHETKSDRTRATTDDAAIDFCFSKLRRINVRGTGLPVSLSQKIDEDFAFRVDPFGNVVCRHAHDRSMTKFDVDHVFPWIRGGRSIRDNFWVSSHRTPLCSSTAAFRAR